MQKITPYLWFDDDAEEAAKFYVSIFKNSKIESLTREAGPKSRVMFVTFRLAGQEFYALNGGKFMESSSLQQYHSMLTAKPRRKSTISGRDSRKEARKGDAAGWKTNTVSHGR